MRWSTTRRRWRTRSCRVPEIRRAIAPSILWAAITTISAFLVLNLGGLPGLAQLGTLVAIGIGLAALVMVMIYLPPLFPGSPARLAPAGTPPAGGPISSRRSETVGLRSAASERKVPISRAAVAG